MTRDAASHHRALRWSNAERRLRGLDLKAARPAGPASDGGREGGSFRGRAAPGGYRGTNPWASFARFSGNNREDVMPYWGWILIIVGLSIVAVAIFYVSLHLPHRTIPAKQVPQGDPDREISAPLPLDVVRADDAMESGDAMTAREIEEERRRETRLRARTRAATYEIVSRGSSLPATVVTDLPPAEVGEVLFHQGHFWRVEAIEPAQSRDADGRLIVTITTDEPKPTIRSR